MELLHDLVREIKIDKWVSPHGHTCGGCGFVTKGMSEYGILGPVKAYYGRYNAELIASRKDQIRTFLKEVVEKESVRVMLACVVRGWLVSCAPSVSV